VTQSAVVVFATVFKKVAHAAEPIVWVVWTDVCPGPPVATVSHPVSADDPCGPDAATWTLPTASMASTVPIKTAMRLAEDVLLCIG
jgi:hypothetical protein